MKIDITEKERTTLLGAIGCLIEAEQDSISHEVLTRKLIKQTKGIFPNCPKCKRCMEESDVGNYDWVCKDCDEDFCDCEVD